MDSDLMKELSELSLDFYLVRSKDGKWLRSKGYSGSGDNWIEDINKAKVWQKLGAARSQVTYWANAYPKYGTPDIIHFKAGVFKVLDESERVEKANQARQKAEKRREIRNLKSQIERAEQLQKKKQDELERLKQRLGGK